MTLWAVVAAVAVAGLSSALLICWGCARGIQSEIAAADAAGAVEPWLAGPG